MVLSHWRKKDAFNKIIVLERMHAKENNKILTCMEEEKISLRTEKNYCVLTFSPTFNSKIVYAMLYAIFRKITYICISVFIDKI